MGRVIPKPGDHVTYIGGFKEWKGATGVCDKVDMTRTGGKYHWIEDKSGRGKWSAATNLKITRRPMLGDNVEIIDDWWARESLPETIGMTGEIIKDDPCAVPFKVRLSNGTEHWYGESSVKVTGSGKENTPHLPQRSLSQKRASDRKTL